MLNNKYRDIKNYVVNTNNSDVENLTLFGIYKVNKDYNDLSKELTEYVNTYTTYENIGILFNLNEVVSNDNINDLSIALGLGIAVALDSKVESMSSLNSIKDFEEIRDNIIKTLDKLNFITKNGYDVKLENGVSSSVNLTSFNNSNFYSEYGDCINYIKNNVSTMDDKLNKDIDAPTGLNDENKNKFTLNTLTTEDKTIIMKHIKDYTDYSDELYDKIDNHIGKFLKEPKTYNLRYGKKPKRKNNKPVVFNIGTETVTTTTPEIKQIFATNNINVTGSLNYYKK